MGFLIGAIDARTRSAEGDFRKETRFVPENLAHNLVLIDLLKRWAERKQAMPGQIALAWLMAQKPWIVPIPGSTQMPHMLENIGAVKVELGRCSDKALLNLSFQSGIPGMINDAAIIHMVPQTKVSRTRHDICFLKTGASICPPRLRQVNHSVEAETVPAQNNNRFSP